MTVQHSHTLTKYMYIYGMQSLITGEQTSLITVH